MVDDTKHIPVSPKTKKRVEIAKAMSDCGTYDRFLNHLVDLEEGKLNLKIDSEEFSVFIRLMLKDVREELFTDEEFIKSIIDTIPSFVKPVTETR